MSNADEAKEHLKIAAAYLAKVPHASKSLLFVSDSINKYLNGEAASLDHAFGLKLGRGKYDRGDREKHIQLVCNALAMRWEKKPKSWKAISELSGYSEKEFHRLWERYKSEAIQRLADTIQIDFDEPDTE